MKSDRLAKEILLEQYYNSHWDKLVKRVSYRAGGIPNAEDVVQEAFARALHYLDAYEPDRKPFAAWFNTILNNSLREFKNVERRSGMATQEEGIIEELDTVVFQSEVVEQLVNELDEMPEPARDIIRQFIFLGHKAKDIARTLDVNIHTVRKCIQEYYNEVRERYGEQKPAEGIPA